MAYTDSIKVIDNNIKSNIFSNVYLLTGEEKYLLKQNKNKLVEAMVSTDDSMNYVVYKGENAKPEIIADFALTMPFFADRRVVVVENSNFFQKGNEEIEKLLDELPDTTVLVFVEDAVDKRNKLYKKVAKTGTVLEFTSPDEKTLLVWIKSLFRQENIDIEDEAVRRLLSSVGNDMNTLANEAEKIKCYCIEKGRVSVSDVDKLSASQIEDKIFDMMDALARRDKKTTIDLYNDLLALKEPPMKILVLITRQFNILVKVKLAVENGTEPGRIASLVKIPSFFVKKYISQANSYKYEELVERLSLCQETDTSIKTGARRDNVAVEMLIMNLLEQK